MLLHTIFVTRVTRDSRYRYSKPYFESEQHRTDLSLVDFSLVKSREADILVAVLLCKVPKCSKKNCLFS